MTYSLSADASVRRKTGGAILCFLSIIFSNFFIAGNIHWGTGFAIVFLAIMLWAYLRKPVTYIIDEKGITVKRYTGNKTFLLADIKAVERIYRDVLKHAETGGAFGYMNKQNTDIGRVQFYTTRRDNLVLITLQNGNMIMLSPDEPDEFVLAFSNIATVPV